MMHLGSLCVCVCVSNAPAALQVLCPCVEKRKERGEESGPLEESDVNTLGLSAQDLRDQIGRAHV